MSESDLWLILLAFGAVALVTLGGAGLRDWWIQHRHDPAGCRVCRGVDPSDEMQP